MKDGYRVCDGKILVSEYDSSNGNVRQETERKYQDNIGDILVTENVIEYFEGLREGTEDDIYHVEEIIVGNKSSMILKGGLAYIANCCSAGVLSAIVKICLFLGGYISGDIPLFGFDVIQLAALAVCTGITIPIYRKKVIRINKANIKGAKKDLEVLEFKLEQIDRTIEEQQNLLDSLNTSKREDNVECLVHDLADKNSSDYVRLDTYPEIISTIVDDLSSSVAAKKAQNSQKTVDSFVNMLYTEEEIHQYMQLPESSELLNQEVILDGTDTIDNVSREEQRGPRLVKRRRKPGNK